MALELPRHTLMKRAGASLAALAKAIAPHAQTIWIACGPGNNGGDGLVAAAVLHPWAQARGARVLVSWCGNESCLPEDAQFALSLARSAGVTFTPHPPSHCDLAIDALLGLGGHESRVADGRDPHAQPTALTLWMTHLHRCAPLLLCVDVPTGLNADTGINSIAINSINESDIAIYCLTFITLKPGLFTADGRDQAGQVWLDDLGWGAMEARGLTQAPSPTAWLGTWGNAKPTPAPRHNSHKGSFGDVWVLGGQGLIPTGMGMVGAAMLAATAALHAQAGRVFVVTLDPGMPSWNVQQPELMVRSAHTIDGPSALPRGTWVCGCGGGDAIAHHLPKVLSEANALVLDADALNAVAASASLQQLLKSRLARGFASVLTPHPLEAARLLGTCTASVQADRLTAARLLAEAFQCVCVLKGSGTVVASPSGLTTINPTGNARLATAGTGDVLAGMVGAALAKTPLGQKANTPPTPEATGAWLNDVILPAVALAVFNHGLAADRWPPATALTAGALARCITPPASTPPATA